MTIQKENSMSKLWKWILGVGVGLLVVLLVGVPFARRFLWMSSGYMTGQIGVPMGGGFSDGCGGVFGGSMFGMGHMGGGLMMLGMFIVPLLLVGLIVVAVVLIMRRSQPVVVQAQPVAISCGSCGKAVQENWVACPYCGEKTT
jgi:hypothetical protein